MKVYAKFVNPNAGYDYDIKKCKSLTLGEMYEATNISVGRYSTSLSISGFKGEFNSVNFEFYNDSMEPIDIYKMPEFSTYM